MMMGESQRGQRARMIDPPFSLDYKETLERKKMKGYMSIVGLVALFFFFFFIFMCGQVHVHHTFDQSLRIRPNHLNNDASC